MWPLLMGVLAGVLTTVAGLGGGLLLLLWLSRYSDPTRARMLGAFPGAVVGGSLVAVVPEGWVQAAMIVVTLVALARPLLGWQWRSPAGAGMLLGPVLLSYVLNGRAYIGTAAVGAGAMHLGRVLAYGATGLVNEPVLVLAFGLALAIPIGNLLGERVRGWISEPWTARMELGACVVAVGFAVAGGTIKSLRKAPARPLACGENRPTGRVYDWRGGVGVG